MESQICILGAGGELSEQRVRTTPNRFADVLGDPPGLKATTVVSPQRSHCTRSRPCSSRPHLRYASNSRRTNAGQPPVPFSQAGRVKNVGRWIAMVR
jgi:hypothetical protein